MGLKINGSDVSSIFFNNIAITSIMFNNTSVWSSAPAETEVEINDFDASIVYGGSWWGNVPSGRGRGTRNDDVHYSDITEAYVEYTFTGHGVDFVTEAGPDGVAHNVYIDNVFVQQINPYQAEYEGNKVVFSINNLSEGEHTIKVVNTTGYIFVDGFNYRYGEEIVVPPSETVVYLSSFTNVAGLVTTYTGSINSGSNSLTLTSSHDFIAGMGITVKGAGSYAEGWLRTTVSAVNGNVITLATTAVTTVSGQSVSHDDSVALQSAIDSLEAGTEIIFDKASMNIGDVSLKSGITYNGTYNGTRCCVYTPTYYSQSSPDTIYTVFRINSASDIIVKNLEMNGRKSTVLGNDQYGASFFITEDMDTVTFQDIYAHDNWYVAFRCLEDSTDVTFKDCIINYTDVAICFMAKWQGTCRVNGLIIDGVNIYARDCNSEAIAIIPATYNWYDYTNNVQLAQCDNVLIKNCTIEKNNRVALVPGGSIGTNIIIEDNTFVESMFAISSLDGVIELKNSGGTFTPSMNSSDNMIIRRNSFGITLWETLRLTGKNVVLDNNTFGSTGGGAFIISQDSNGTTGTFEVKNHTVALGSKQLISTDSTHKFSGLYLHDNTITGNSGVYAVYMQSTDGVANVQNNSGSTSLNCRVKTGSSVETADWANVYYV